MERYCHVIADLIVTEGSGLMPIDIRNEQKAVPVKQVVIKRMLKKCLLKLNIPQAELSVLLTTDAQVRRLNRLHRGIDKPTDILSFGMRERRFRGEPLPPDPDILGDLVISMPAIKRQAVERTMTVQAELIFILIHGILHLIGYDHASKTQKLRMDALHQSLLAACQEK